MARSDAIPVLRASLLTVSDRDPPSTEGFGESLEKRVAGQPYLSRDWAPRNGTSYLLGDPGQHPGLLLLSDDERREFMFALRPARGMGRVSIIRNEALLAGLADGDTARMFDGLWTYGRLDLATRLNSASGTDYSASFIDHLETLAVGDDDLADDRFPSSAPRSSSGYRFFVVATNVIRALRYGLDRDAAHEEAVRFSAGKSTKKFEALLTRYLVALLDEDAVGAQQLLAEIATTWTTTPWVRNWHDPLHKVLSLQLHGYAALGERVLPGVSEAAADTPAWSTEFAQLVAERRAADDVPVPRAVVDLPGVTGSLAVVFTPRPFADYAARSR